MITIVAAVEAIRERLKSAIGRSRGARLRAGSSCPKQNMGAAELRKGTWEIGRRKVFRIAKAKAPVTVTRGEAVKAADAGLEISNSCCFYYHYYHYYYHHTAAGTAATTATATLLLLLLLLFLVLLTLLVLLLQRLQQDS